ncbi:putative plus-end-directed kinesin ATPase [Rosa chinensis]|uniref:Putative plus-end-directed kinesin ATPase n=1 Tax=Rosa chinensis TaxID=74649 RepID=A0A2P6PJV8_ROSCH|nr:putative plus-end-directed kinesin ATPase [Rosa chinensis]
MGSYLVRGSLPRATGSTNMNSQSSRSHAIFTITMEQKKISHCLNGANNDDIGDDILCAKLHLVDLAGSERAKRTGADGMHLKEALLLLARLCQPYSSFHFCTCSYIQVLPSSYVFGVKCCSLLFYSIRKIEHTLEETFIEIKNQGYFLVLECDHHSCFILLMCFRLVLWKIWF